MPTAAQQIVEAAAAVPWLEIVKTAAPVVTAWIAFKALRNWQRQDRAKREAEFLDSLIDAVHLHVVEMQRPVQLLRAAKIGMASHVNSWGPGEAEERVVAGAIAYIRERGAEDGKRLREALVAIEPGVVRLKSLAVKGQVFQFSDYKRCHDAIAKLTWHFGRINAFNSVIENPTWNWKREEVSSLLGKVMKIEPDEIMAALRAENSAIIAFVRDSYALIYG